MGVSEAAREVAMFGVRKDVARVGDSRPKRSETCLVDILLIVYIYCIWYDLNLHTHLNSGPIISFVVVTVVLLCQVRFWEPCHFDCANCYFFGFEQRFHLDLQFRWLRKKIQLNHEKNPGSLVNIIYTYIYIYIRGLYYPVIWGLRTIISHYKNPYWPTNIMGCKKGCFFMAQFTKALIIPLIASRGRIHPVSLQIKLVCTSIIFNHHIFYRIGMDCLSYPFWTTRREDWWHRQLRSSHIFQSYAKEHGTGSVGGHCLQAVCFVLGCLWA